MINNDENGNGARDSVANWSDLTGNGWASTENYGALKLNK
ncbi:sugar-binding protein [Cellulosilyticum ruminicola]|nr:sugar-binding protein [Cellulosilyticum ruminicola]